MTQCVCGHPPADHRDTLMSVPLVGTGRYMPHGPLQIAVTNLAATYDQVQCWCGCCEYLPDDRP
jgi:hypothetical protein